jgi:hypothetical protein
MYNLRKAGDGVMQILEDLFQDMTIIKNDLERENSCLLEEMYELKGHNKVDTQTQTILPPLHPHIQSQYRNFESRADTLDGQLLMQMIEDEREAKLKARRDR